MEVGVRVARNWPVIYTISLTKNPPGTHRDHNALPRKSGSLSGLRLRAVGPTFHPMTTFPSPNSHASNRAYWALPLGRTAGCP